MASGGEQEHPGGFPWRAATLCALTVALFVAALWFYNHAQTTLGLALLGAAFCVPMLWVVIAARAAAEPDSPLAKFIPRITAWLVLGSAFLGIFWWSVDRRITLMEAGFAAFYIVAAWVALRSLKAGSKRARLAVVGSSHSRPRPLPRSPRH